MDDSALPESNLGIALVAVLAVLVVAYSLLIAQQVLVVVWFAATAVTLWLLYRFVVAVESIADAQQRMARDGRRPGGDDAAADGRGD